MQNKRNLFKNPKIILKTGIKKTRTCVPLRKPHRLDGKQMNVGIKNTRKKSKR